MAQEYQNVFASSEREGSNGIPCFGFHKADRRVTCFYFDAPASTDQPRANRLSDGVRHFHLYVDHAGRGAPPRAG